jgi:putative flippase GtrA
MLKKFFTKEFVVQIFKFGIVGLLNTGISLLVFLLLSDVLKINDKISDIASYVIGLINSFIFNKLWTFQAKDFSYKELFLFILFFGVSFSLQYGCYTLLKDHYFVQKNISYIIGMVVYTGTNFLLNKFFTFKK